MALHLQRLLSVELHNAGDAESVEFVFDDGAVHQLSRSPDGRGIFYKFFDQPLTFARLSVSVRRPRQPSSDKPFTITCDAVASKLQGNEFRCRWNSRLIIFKVVPQCIPVGVPSPSESMSTDSGSLQIGPRYRILIFGQTGVGKSSLINQVLGREAARVENDRSGKADINKELTSPENDRFILHDSQGFEPAESDNHKVVKAFIERRKMMRNLRDQLHAVWLCFQVTIPTHGERPLEEHAEIFLKEAKIILGNNDRCPVPVIVVFTKYDRLLTFMRAKRKGKDPEQEAAQYLKTNCIDAIRNVSGDQNILHVEFSSRRKHERGVDKLVKLTCNKVSDCFSSYSQPSVAL